jgi:hypothetical protein
MLTILIVTGLVVYGANYTIGWLLNFKVISISKRTHQIFFALIIANLILLLFFLRFLSLEFIMCFASLVSMLILPFGKKGGAYHIMTASLGLSTYLAAVLLLI